MATKVRNTALRKIETLFAVGAIGGLSDGQLIERFLSGTQDEAETAFAAVVDRHGAMAGPSLCPWARPVMRSVPCQ